MFERRRHLKLNNAILLQKNEVCETSGLKSCHVCIVSVTNPRKKYVVVSHYRVMDANEHVCRIHSILQSCVKDGAASKVNILLFRLASDKLIDHHASLGSIYHIDKYESTTKLLKSKLVQIFPDANIQEIPYDLRKKDGDWIRVSARKNAWLSSFGSGFIEKSR